MSRRSIRRASTLVAALVCLAIITSVAGSLIVAVADRVHRHRTAAHRAQAEWLAESALERAAARLAADPEYAGETWQIDADELDGRAGRAEIAIDAGSDGKRTIRVQAAYPATGRSGVTASRDREVAATGRPNASAAGR